MLDYFKDNLCKDYCPPSVTAQKHYTFSLFFVINRRCSDPEQYLFYFPLRRKPLYQTILILQKTKLQF